jgi:Rhamnan synthesis protein F
MTLPPAWKVKRELRRIRGQAERAGSKLSEPPLRYLHNIWLSTAARPLSGSLTLGSKVAVLVLYQPQGVARSLFLTCGHLIENNYSPFILSNAPLSADDRTALLARAAFVIERPNFGYDFGAYQDDIRLLEKMGHQPDRLILMNDSTWFPLRANDTSIARMEASGDAFTGLAFRNEPNTGRGRDHMEAHMLMFHRSALKCDAFGAFWDRYPASSNRDTTIERGEKGITWAMFDAGFTSSGLASRHLLLARLSSTSFQNLHSILAAASFHPTILRERAFELLAAATDSFEWRRQVLDHMNDHLHLFAPMLSTTLIYGAMKEMDLGFVKKSQEERFHLARIQVLELEAAGEIEALDPDVRAEMSASVANWKRG